MEGLIRCSIVQPDKLYHPVLPYSLVINSCSACVEHAFTPASAECKHTEDMDCALTLTWVMDEIRFAVQKRYRLLEMYEVYEYQVTQYNPETGEGVTTLLRS